MVIFILLPHLPLIFSDTACMSIQMTFKELFDHLGLYIRDPDQRWKHVMRVKCDLEDCSGYGGSGKDQAYFAGEMLMRCTAGAVVQVQKLVKNMFP